MSKVIVIGGSGFLGSHVADYLSYAGHKVSIFDKNEPIYLKENQIFIKGDTLSEKHINNALKNHQVVYNFSLLVIKRILPYLHNYQTSLTW